jgi:hypothetical protein
MARIRSIKPEFWKDGRIKRLTPACALFFIGLWNFCDDEGKTRTDSLELSLNLPLFRSQDIVKHLRSLAEVGLIRLSRDTEWLLVESWDHQKIDKPRQPRVSKSEIEWLELLRKDHSPNALRDLVDESSNTRRKDRIGKDRKGEDRIVAEPAGAGPREPEKSVETTGVDEKGPSPTAVVWRAYKAAYEGRYHAAPPWNAKTAGMLRSFTTRVPLEEAPDVAAHYVSHNDRYYVQAMHPVGFLLRDAEKLRTEWFTGRKVTSETARQAERQDYTRDQMDRIRRGEL